MTHLGADVAAFVDGQLPEPSMAAARRHLQGCPECQQAVQQQWSLKSRVRSVNAPEPPQGLVASLAGLQNRPVETETLWARLRRSVPVTALVAMTGACVLVMAAGYVLAPAAGERGDPVTPMVGEYVVAFNGSGQSTTQSVMQSISWGEIAQLNDSGWACHAFLGNGFRRVGASFAGDGQIVDLTYQNAASSLKLFEETGALNITALDDFERHELDRGTIWLRDGEPLVAAWDSNGIVYTVVTDARKDELGAILAPLPMRAETPEGLARVGSGIARMASWVGFS